MPVIGFLSTRSARDLARLIAAFGKGWRKPAFPKARNLSIDWRFADGRLDRLPELAADLVRRSVAVLVTTGARLRRSRPKQRHPPFPLSS